MPSHTILALSSLGAALMLAGIFEDGKVDASDVRTIGAVLILATVIVAAMPWALSKLPRSTQAAYELGRSDGYREGYDEGRSAARPVVVRFPATQHSLPDVAPCGTRPATLRTEPAAPDARHGGRIGVMRVDKRR